MGVLLLFPGGWLLQTPPLPSASLSEAGSRPRFASAGAMELMTVHAARNLPRTLEGAREAGWSVVGAALAFASRGVVQGSPLGLRIDVSISESVSDSLYTLSLIHI